MGVMRLSRDSRDFPQRDFRELSNFSRDSRSSYIAAGTAGTGNCRDEIAGRRSADAGLLGTILTRWNDD